MHDKDVFMIADSPNGRVNIGTVNLDADGLSIVDGSYLFPDVVRLVE